MLALAGVHLRGKLEWGGDGGHLSTESPEVHSADYKHECT